MGFGWAVFMPLLNTALFSVIFVRVAPIDTGVPYPVWVYCGLAVWNFFSAGVKFATNSLASNMNLVTKVYFPREILPISAVFVSAVDFLVSTTVLAALMVWYGVKPGWPLLFVPFLLLLHIMLTAAVSLLLSMANVFYRDVKYLVEALMMVWMFATSVVYPIEQIGGRLGSVMALNPMTPLVDAFRAAVLYNRPPSAAGLPIRHHRGGRLARGIVGDLFIAPNSSSLKACDGAANGSPLTASGRNSGAGSLTTAFATCCRRWRPPCSESRRPTRLKARNSGR